ncbi:MAG: glycosyltransferase [Ginsengibacter sp.]
MNNIQPKLSIAFFVDSFPVISETFIVNQVIALINDGHRVHIFAQSTNATKQIHPAIIKAGLLRHTTYVHALPAKRIQKIILFLGRLFQNPNKRNAGLIKYLFKNNTRKKGMSIYQLISFLDKPEYDILHAHFGFIGNYVLSLKKMGLFPKAKFITTFHGYDLIVEKNVYEQLFHSCELFTVNTSYTKEKLIDLGCQQSKICLLPAGLDTTLFNKKNAVEKGNNLVSLLFAGRLIALKGPLLFIEICKKLKQNSIVFNGVIAGNGELYNELQALIKSSGLSNEIKMVGDQIQDEIINLMNDAEVFILPGIVNEGRAETQGLVIQEAQAMELPVIVSDAGGMKE